MGNYFYVHDEEEEEAEDALSFCDLPIHDGQPECDEFSQKNPNPSLEQDLFEFFAIPKDREMNPAKHIIFCGKLIPYEQEDRSRSKSLNTSYDVTRARSLRIQSSKSSPLPPPATGSFRYSSTSAGKPRKHAFMFGIGKFPLTMDLSDMRKRQSRRTPAPLVPAVDGGGMVVTGKEGRERGNWGLLRLLKCRSHFRSAFRTSFGCVPLV